MSGFQNFQFAHSHRWALVLMVSLGALCAHAASSPAGQGAFTVTLRRQQIPLHNTGGMVHHKSAYYGQIAIGGPQAQLFEVVFDTGSGHLVVPSAMCKAETCRRHRRYRRRASLTAEDIDVDGSVVNPWQARDQITVSFGTGEVTGIFVRDQVCLGPPATPKSGPVMVGTSLIQRDVPRLREVNATPLREDTVAPDGANGTSEAAQPGPKPVRGCVSLRLVSAIDMTEDPFASFAFDGVLGLGLASLSQTPQFNFIESAAAAGAWEGEPWARQLFAVFLAVADSEESEITFGGIRRERMEEGTELAWCSAQDAKDGHWQLDIVSISAGGQKLDYCADGQCRAVVDTGTSLLGVPSDLGPELVRLLRHVSSQADGGCGGPGPRLEIDLGNFTMVLDPADYARPEVVPEHDESPPGSPDGPGETPDAPPMPSEGAVPEAGAATAAAAAGEQAQPEERTCVPMLMHIDLPEPLHPKTLILGEPVLQRYYTAFDASVPRIGFAPARHLEPRTPMTVTV